MLSASQLNIPKQTTGLTDAEQTILDNTSGANSGDATVADTAEIDMTLTGQEIKADIKTGSIILTRLSAAVQAILALASSALQTITSLDIGLLDGDILIGNASNLADNQTMSGDVTISNTGVMTIGTDKIDPAMISTDAVTPDAIDKDGAFTGLTGNWKTTGSLSGQAEFTTDAAGDITITVNAVNYGTDANLGHDADIPDGACDAAADVGNWVVLISKLKNQYSLTSDDATNMFILADNETLTADDELDVDGSMVSVMCIAAEYWKVIGYIDVAPTDGGPAD